MPRAPCVRIVRPVRNVESFDRSFESFTEMKSPRRSKKLFAEALLVLPGGVDSPVRAFTSVGGTPLFISRAFGQPGYGELLATADQARGAGAPSIVQGAQNGSEMGAFSREQNAVNEARRLGIPVVAIVDTNADPEVISYPIAGNDDAIRAIRIVLQKLVDAIVSASGEAKIREQMEMSGVSA